MSNKLKYINKNYKELPKLTSNLKVLYCDNNSLLERLPELPSSLKNLFCYDNLLLTTLPALPKSIIFLDCSGNNLLTTLSRSIIYCKKLIYNYNYCHHYKKYKDLNYLESLPYLINKCIEEYYYKPIMDYYNSKYLKYV